MGRGKNKDVLSYIEKSLKALDDAIDWVKAQDDPFIKDTKEKRESLEFTPKWTADKIDLIELSYSLYSAKAINNGEASLKSIVKFICDIFGEKPGNYASTYATMRLRVSSRTLFLDELKKSLEKKMDLNDEGQEKKGKKR